MYCQLRVKTINFIGNAQRQEVIVQLFEKKEKDT